MGVEEVGGLSQLDIDNFGLQNLPTEEVDELRISQEVASKLAQKNLYEDHQFTSTLAPATKIDPTNEHLFSSSPKRVNLEPAKKPTINLGSKFLTDLMIPKMHQLEEVLRKDSQRVEDINITQEALLEIKAHLAKFSENDKKKMAITPELETMLKDLEAHGTKLIELGNSKELSLVQLIELKEQINKNYSKLQTEVQTIVSTKISPTLTERNAISDIAKTIMRIYLRLIDSIVENSRKQS